MKFPLIIMSKLTTYIQKYRKHFKGMFPRLNLVSYFFVVFKMSNHFWNLLVIKRAFFAMKLNK